MLVEDFANGDSPALCAGELVPRQTIESIVRKRNHALECFKKSWDRLAAAREALELASGALRDLRPSETRFNYHVKLEESKFIGHLQVQDYPDYMKDATRIVDVEAWSYIIEITDLQRLMDKKAKTDLFQQLLTTPPEATVDNIQATLQQFVLDADTIFKRGIANCFSALDRRFRSHDGFKIGRRIILDRMFTEYGSFNYHRDMESTLMDIERTFMVLEGLQVPDAWSGIVGALRENRSQGFGCRQGTVESEFFRVNIFKNGNAHIWFKRDDLVEKVNKLLAEYYGAAIPDGMEPEDDGGLYTPKTALAKNDGWFPTPEVLATKVLEDVPILQGKDEERLTILEPSAGLGALARMCLTRPMRPEGGSEWQVERANSHNAQYRFDNVIDCVEINADRAQALRFHGIYRDVYCTNFLALNPGNHLRYHRIIMNPPFDRELDIDHVIHAMQFLRHDGFLCAIMSAGTEFRDTKKSMAFRALMRRRRARFRDLPPGSFSSVGTYVNTIQVTFWNDGRSHHIGGHYLGQE